MRTTLALRRTFQHAAAGIGNMWWAEHAIMATVFGGFALWFLWKRNYSWLGAAALSQVPFWGGMLAFMATNDTDPVGVNLALNLMVAGIFIHWADRLQVARRGGVVHVWLCVIFVAAGTIDIAQVVYSFPNYVLLQEVIHYLALIAIGGRAYVRGFDGNRRHSRNTLDPKAGGGLV